MNNEKEIEMKARLEKERISRIINNVDEQYLTALNSEKKLEIEQLRNLKNVIEKQEKLAIKEITKLQSKISAQEKEFNEKQKRLKQIKHAKGSKLAQIHDKIVQTAKVNNFTTIYFLIIFCLDIFSVSWQTICTIKCRKREFRKTSKIFNETNE